MGGGSASVVLRIVLEPTGPSTAAGETPLGVRITSSHMVVNTERDDATWYECETCGLLFDEQSDATEHEKHCDGSDPSYIQ